MERAGSLCLAAHGKTRWTRTLFSRLKMMTTNQLMSVQDVDLLRQRGQSTACVSRKRCRSLPPLSSRPFKAVKQNSTLIRMTSPCWAFRFFRCQAKPRRFLTVTRPKWTE
ncbi:hypothetical protein PILCRDRAFT_100805 [Piloderma croceum F 1598]|uniref:Uncharacterized protein n=1 Tax=Piloderma croceum (strain F 1598) TaxID=765440 RepID=A0A0C3G6F7_PILCF|nr:hypothetical protein PILCRDRAFT_100805 [Piloderma croceum F 1598]